MRCATNCLIDCSMSDEPPSLRYYSDLNENDTPTPALALDDNVTRRAAKTPASLVHLENGDVPISTVTNRGEADTAGRAWISAIKLAPVKFGITAQERL